VEQTYLRGELYYADLGKGIGSEQEGFRPVVIIQNDMGNKYSPTVIVAALSSKVNAKAKLPTHFYLGAESGLALPSVVLAEQLRTIDKRRLAGYIGRLTDSRMRGVDQALAVSIGLSKPMPQFTRLCLCTECADVFFSRGNAHLRPATEQDEKAVCISCGQKAGTYYDVIVKGRESR